jgi:hypothetical protein
LITIAMPTDTHGPASSGIPMPTLSDYPVVQIHDFIAHVLDLFKARYGDQIHRYYDRSAHNMIRPHTSPNIDDPPF